MKIIASGTFDRLHEGHKFFLAEAFHRGFVMIGLCADSMVIHKHLSSMVYPYDRRKTDLEEYLASEGYIQGEDFLILKIEDAWGFADDIEDIDAILVTPDVRENAEKINEIRRSKGWNDLEIIEISLLKDQKGVISSTRLREEEECD
ncbi:MAG: pantetheine-phosphate adenylyltransferase [Theionarchaea archaeon]|nr:pantetheine-phosphate adenylyltransferase [Theionarchaea archaeon]